MQDPLPLEQTDPGLAEHIRLIVAGKHLVKRMHVFAGGVRFTLHSGFSWFKKFSK